MVSKHDLEEIEKFLHAREDEVDPWRMFRIMTEFFSGFDFLRQFKRAVTIFGSARFKYPNKAYKEAEKLAALLAKENFAIVTGAGPGIMEAANKGAHKAGGTSVGIAVRLPHEDAANKYAKLNTYFKYFFTRKVMLVYASQLYVFFPGGFGTLDEFFELVTLVQTKKIKPVPIILIDKQFWTPLLKWVDATLVGTYKTVNPGETGVYTLVDSAEEAVVYIKSLLKYNSEHFTR
ncbi:MAG TPA: TIGR00730 family Rossman fold protein [Patescibacteria group bacterium]|nr:TIGR00730 family Rossman fold protein [Patescibacteria group bacterium]